MTKNVLLWYLQHHHLETHECESVDEAVSFAAYMQDSGNGSPDSIEAPDLLIQGPEFDVLVWEGQKANAAASDAFRKECSFVGTIRVRHHTEDEWSRGDAYTDVGLAQEAFKRLVALLGSDRVEWIPSGEGT